jgi:hypothetical protein
MVEVTPTGQFLAEITSVPGEEFYFELTERPGSGANDASELPLHQYMVLLDIYSHVFNASCCSCLTP